MKRYKVKKYILIFIAMFVISSCVTTSYTKEAYNTLATSAEAYDVTMSILGEMYAQGRISDAQKDKAILYGEDFWLAYHAAVDALETYSITKDKPSVNARMAALSKALGGFLAYFKTIIGD